MVCSSVPAAKERRGPACDSSWLLRDGPSSARPSCPAPHPMGLPTLCPLALSTRKAVKQGSRKHRRTRGTGKAGTGPAPKAAPNTGPATQGSITAPPMLPALPALLQTAAHANELLIISLSQQQSQGTVSFVQERFIQTATE